MSSSQVYLMLLRHPFPDSEAMLLMQIKTMLGSMIRGDSLDVPFMNCIKCHSFSHSIGGGGFGYGERSGAKVGAMSMDEYKKGVVDSAMVVAGPLAAAGERRFGSAGGYAGAAVGGAISTVGGAIAGGVGGGLVAAGRGIGSKIGAQHTATGAAASSKWLYDDGAEPGLLSGGKMPTHNSVSFSKNLDSASPQLSFGCSAQERFPIAIFFLRKKTGFKLGGVTHPHTVLAYTNCLITDWETDGDTETVGLNYESMGMASFLQIADTPIPQGISWRHWDKVNNEGGEKGWSALLIPLTAAVVAIGGAAVTAAGAATGSGENYFEQ